METVRGLIAESFSKGTLKRGYKPKPRGTWWFAYKEGIPVAFAVMLKSVQWQKTGYLALSGVHPAHRGHGLQKRLIQKRVEHARRLGWPTLITETIHDNAASMRSLISCGFKPYLPRKPWGHSTAVYWRKQI
jgi:GNAT superfamily N-acetyltransferase